MTPQERQLIEQLFDRLAKLEREPRDAEAERTIREGLARAPNAIYALVQTAILQDEALRRANERIEEMQAELDGDQRPAEGGGFLDRMRNTMFGGDERRGGGSVPSVRPSDMERRDDRWGAGPPVGVPPGYRQEPGGSAPGGPFGAGYGYGSGSAGPGAAPGGNTFGGGSFLGTAAAAAAGAIGGSLLLNSIRGMTGPAHAGQGAINPGTPGSDRSSPWGGGDAANSDLARQAGADDISRAGSGRQYGAVDEGSSRSASADRDAGGRDAGGRDEDHDRDDDYDDDDSDLDFGDDSDFDTV